MDVLQGVFSVFSYPSAFMYVSICLPSGCPVFAFCRGGMESYVYYYISLWMRWRCREVTPFWVYIWGV